MEVFGTNRLGQFDIKDGIANNMLLENGGSLRVEEMTSLIIPLWIVAAYWRLWMAGLQLALIKKQAEN